MAASGRYLIRWCCVPGYVSSAFMAAEVKWVLMGGAIGGLCVRLGLIEAGSGRRRI
ncbi:hypothetical protein KCP69_24030 [Salmonella enterica subsp. enterica]|nr:hypothetical protein KCP69_24030 [Salmonella enterica subsp. enterica]